MIILSLTLLLSVTLILHYKQINRYLLGFCLLGIVAYLYALIAFCLFSYFTGDGFTVAVWYHLVSGLEGVNLYEYLYLIVIVVSAFIFSLFVPLFVFKRKLCSSSPIQTTTPLSCVLIALLTMAIVTNPLLLDVWGMISTSQNNDEFHFADYFHEFNLVDADKLDKKNLVVIYLESFERTYLNQQLFPGLTPNIQKLEEESLSFLNVEQLASSYWTIGGMVASQCGIPLVTPSDGNSMSGVENFYSRAFCLGDILTDQGYELSYYGGADLSFAGKGAFFKSHGFDNVMGAKELGIDSMEAAMTHGWGFYDETLFSLALKEYKRLSSAEKPFALFMLTLDTHHPDGWPSPVCEKYKYGDGTNSMLNSISCSDALVGNFIEQLLLWSDSEETIIIVLSDHLAMRNSVTSTLNKTKRSNLLFVVTPDKRKDQIVKRASSLDVAPTILGLLGLDGVLGLGVDLLSDREPLISRLNNLDKILMGWRHIFLKYWDFSIKEKDMLFDENTKTAIIGQDSFRLPFLLTSAGYSNTTFYYESASKSLDKYLFEQAPNTMFVMADQCKEMWFLGDAAKYDGSCVVYGKLGADINVQKIDGVVEFSSKVLKEMTGKRYTKKQYEKNINKIFAHIMGPDLLTTFISVPHNSTVYVTKTAYGKYPHIYTAMPWMEKKGIRCVRDVPIDSEFYFVSDDIAAARNWYPDYDLEIYKETETGIEFAKFVQQHLDETVVISAMDEASSSLSDDSIDYFEKLGITLGKLGFRDSFACIIHKGKVLDWGIKSNGLVSLNDISLKKSGLEIVVSGGKTQGNLSKIVINGKNLSLQRRGMNVVVIADDGKVLQKSFDTYSTEWSGAAIVRALPK